MKSKYDVQTIILCGGQGTRLWPVSRSGFPKQFMSLFEDKSPFQQAALRFSNFKCKALNISQPIIVTDEEYRFLVLEQIHSLDINIRATILEPIAKNTAPALTLAALLASSDGSDPILVVTPSDHVIRDEKQFHFALENAVRSASDGNIITLGIEPLHPEIGYGYIKTEKDNKKVVLNVDKFVEKPDHKQAQQYLEEGGYFWNSGMFVMRASTWLQAIKNHRPDIYNGTKKAWKSRQQDGKAGATFFRPNVSEYRSVPAESIDYAVLEKCPDSSFSVEMIVLDAGWNDLGSWNSVWQDQTKDKSGNIFNGDVIAFDAKNSFVHSTGRLVSLVGVENLIVAETPDAILVASREKSQFVKNVVSILQSSERNEHKHHRKIFRPWGNYDSIDAGDNFKVKRIQVKPGASLSLQKHHRRAEHWVVVKGVAEVTRNEEKFLLHENQSTYIPLGSVHRLSNPGKKILEIIEVQTGEYLEEDDIVRFEDDYGRI